MVFYSSVHDCTKVFDTMLKAFDMINLKQFGRSLFSCTCRKLGQYILPVTGAYIFQITSQQVWSYGGYGGENIGGKNMQKKPAHHTCTMYCAHSLES